MHKQLQDLLTKYDIELDDEKINQLIIFVNELAKWNKVYNLTAIKSVDEMLVKHILDSLSILAYVDDTNLLDVGSGAGLPGVVLAVAKPNLQVTVLDCNIKKIQFLNNVKIKLKLDNLQVIHSRIEDYTPEAKFSQITSRAFASVDKFVEKSWIFLAPNGRFLAMKGAAEKTSQELNALDPRFAVQSIFKLDLDDCLGERALVVIGSATTWG